MTTAPKILAFAASSSSTSINRALVQHAANEFKALVPGASIELLDLRDYDLPLFSVDREKELGSAEAAQRFLSKIADADGVLVSFAEHNGLYTAAYKNLFDWASRILMKVYQSKPVVALSTSPGPGGGSRVLGTFLSAAPYAGAEVVGSLSVPRFGESFDSDSGALTDERSSQQLGKILRRFATRLGAEETRPSLFGAAMWDERFAQAHAAYGTDPNAFVRAVAPHIPEGPVLVVAAGEGRDAVFLAERGHDVTAIDLSEVGLRHAQELASERGVSLKTVVTDVADFDFGEAKWAGIVAIWAHVPAELRKTMHAACVRGLQPGGAMVLEAYTPRHFRESGHGGPPRADMMLTPADARAELEGLRFDLCQEVTRTVSEGRDHSGVSATTQVLAIKP